MFETLLEIGAGLGAAFLAGTFLEYAVHRAMHTRRLRRTWLGRIHLEHHKNNNLQPLRKEIFDYLPIAFLMMPFGLPFGWAFFGGWAAGAAAYALLVAFVHNMFHLSDCHLPECLCQLHRLHHAVPSCNFGIMCSFWDVLFRTRRKTLREPAEASGAEKATAPR